MKLPHKFPGRCVFRGPTIVEITSGERACRNRVLLAEMYMCSLALPVPLCRWGRATIPARGCFANCDVEFEGWSLIVHSAFATSSDRVVLPEIVLVKALAGQQSRQLVR